MQGKISWWLLVVGNWGWRLADCLNQDFKIYWIDWLSTVSDYE